ncbi:unnamed protein product [Prorocentrum cordatum]|uniref:Uncharacterized protein n=1 Tax=Prorocentrum cordatum TaxID=2364126 RepID=A0ABN9YF31_9DINO|nr:unnamed protein product [Polarella glacialis]
MVSAAPFLTSCWHASSVVIWAEDRLHMFTTNLLSRTRRPFIQEETETFPHMAGVLPISGRDIDLKVRVLKAPRAVPRQPAVSFSRHPERWHMVEELIDAACEDNSLGVAWDAALAHLVLELLGQRDLAEAEGELHRGQDAKLRWQPPLRRGARSIVDMTSAAAACWARHLRRHRQAFIRQVTVLLIDEMPEPGADKAAKTLVDITRCWARAAGVAISMKTPCVSWRTALTSSLVGAQTPCWIGWRPMAPSAKP